MSTEPHYANGKICYVEIPAEDIRQSSQFYQRCFDWELREDNHGNIAFNDSVGQVSGMWVTGRKPQAEIGIVISIMVNDIPAAAELIKSNGGTIINIDMDSSEKTAWFSDPFGNCWGLYQQSGL